MLSCSAIIKGVLELDDWEQNLAKARTTPTLAQKVGSLNSTDKLGAAAAVKSSLSARFLSPAACDSVQVASSAPRVPVRSGTKQGALEVSSAVDRSNQISIDSHVNASPGMGTPAGFVTVEEHEKLKAHLKQLQKEILSLRSQIAHRS